jgi:hypothetical protein
VDTVITDDVAAARRAVDTSWGRPRVSLTNQDRTP